MGPLGKKLSSGSISKARASLTMMERSQMEERKKVVKTAMKEKAETRNRINFRSSGESNERY